MCVRSVMLRILKLRLQNNFCYDIISLDKEKILNFRKSKEVNSMGIYKSNKGKEAILSLYERQLERLDKKYENHSSRNHMPINCML